MDKTTIMLPSSLRLKALTRAQKMGISLGELIRTSLDSFLRNSKERSVSDPLLADGVFYEGEAPADLSEKHDEYLYGAK